MAEPREQRAIAIVSAAGRFPGAPNLEALWRMILERRSASTEVPTDRWPVDREELLDPKGSPDRLISTRGCFLDPFRVDASGLEVDQALVDALDPLHQLALAVGAEAFRGKGETPLDRGRTAVILANIVLPTDAASRRTRELLGLEGASARAADPSRPEELASLLDRQPAALPAALIARALGLGGGSYTLDAACASSLYALHLACLELEAGRVDAVLAGGISRPQSLYTQVGFTQLQALSPSGTCSPFDTRADGLVVGEGAGIFLLQRLEDALREGREILGVIRGIGLSNDMGGSLLSPEREGQLRAMRSAYQAAGWRPDEVDLIECHGTGTPRGDGVELASLRALWAEADRPAEGEAPAGGCVIGSVKSNVGHLLTAAAATGLAKVLLALREGVLPPSANFASATAAPGLAEGPFRILEEAAPWARRGPKIPRRAAVSAFGFGGINAHLLVEEWLPEAAAPSQDARPRLAAAPVAIVGMAAHFGKLRDLSTFREAIFRGEPALGPRPAHRWSGATPPAGAAGLEALPGAWIDQLEIPLGRFRIPPNELPSLLPQQLLALEVAAAAVEDAGEAALGPSPRLRTGALVGLGLDPETTNFHLRWLLRARLREQARRRGEVLDEARLERELEARLASLGPALDSARTLGALGGVVAGRIARELQLGGPSFSVAGEDASGLRALEVAVRLLQAGDVDAMVVGAVDLAGDLRQLQGVDPLRPYTRVGRVRPFDRAADGPAPGEGAAAVVVKRLDDALRDGDRIYAVVRGIGAASGGGLGQGPAEKTYLAALERAWAEARIPRARVGLLEVDGSGSPALDRLEAGALRRFFGEAEEPRCALSATKAVIGHAGAAGGLASIVSASLALFHELLPPLPACREPAFEGWSGSPFHVQREAQAWLRNRAEGPRVAGVSAIALDGGCLHAVLEGVDRPASAHRRERARPLGDRGVGLFLCAGADEAALARSIDALRAHFQREAPIEALAAAWYRGAEARNERGARNSAIAPGAPLVRAFVGGSADELLRQLDRPRRGGRLEGELAFVFPGSGNHYIGMGRSLGAAFPEPLRALDAETEHLRDQMMPARFAPWRIAWPKGVEAQAARALEQTPERIIMGQVAYGVAMSDVIRSFGVQPQAVIGYSLGETAGLFATRTWRDRDGMFGETLRSPLFRTQLAGRCEVAREAWGVEEADWVAAVVNRGADEVRAALPGRSDAWLLIVNAPGECVIGGRRGAVEEVVRALGCEALPLSGVPTVHCELMKPVSEAYRRLHLLPTDPPAGVRFYSAAWGRSYVPTTERAADSILASAEEGFDFPALIERAWEEGVRIFVELGPQGSCTRMIGRILAGKEHLAVTACQRELDPARGVLQALGRLAEAGVPVDLEPLYGEDGGVDLEAEAPAPAKVVVVPNGRPAPAPAASSRPAPSVDGATSPAPSLHALDPMHKLSSPGPANQLPSSAQAPQPAPGTPGAAAIAAPAPQHAASAAPGLGGEATAARPPQQAGSPAFTPSGAAPMADHGSGLTAALLALGELSRGILDEARATAAAHGSFLDAAHRSFQLQQQALAAREQLQRQLAAESAVDTAPAAAAPSSPQPPPMQATAAAAAAPLPLAPAEPPRSFDREACMEFAVGKLGDVFGPAFAVVDGYPTRVRLPDEPLMLVDRILQVDGELGTLGPKRCVTEHDVHEGAWYLDGGRAPVCIVVESGQADLFLCAWAGIDLLTKGERVYRLLDAQMVVHRDLPLPGETVRYDIRVNRFIRQGDTYLLFFEYDATIDGAPLITMRNGCAGFFSQAQLASGRGIVEDRGTTPPARRHGPDGEETAAFRPLVPMGRETFDDEAIDALRAGDVGRAFGPLFEGIRLPEALRLPGGRMRLVDRIIELDPEGGRYGLGVVTGEADIEPDAWFLTCHFADDPVMPGTLMYECCLHTLRVLLLRMGWICDEADAPADLHYAPVIGQESRLRCRGQVIPTTRQARYRIEVKEIGYDPEPYVIADASMYVDELHAVQMEGMSFRLCGLDQAQLEAFWSSRQADPAAHDSVTPAKAGASPAPSAEADPVATLFADPHLLPLERSPGGRPVYTRAHIEAFSTGRPSQAFGAPYLRFDQGRMARLPSDPLSFIDTIVPTAGSPWKLERGARAEAIYEVPPDAWYFAASGLDHMPYAVLLEAALQPCGWLAAWLGAALRSEEPLFFRNLEGEATVHGLVTPREGPLTTRLHLDLTSEAGGMLLQQFTFETSSAAGPILSGTTRFGFFREEALAQQAGIRLPPEGLWRPSGAHEPTPLSTGPYHFLGSVDAIELEGGPMGLGYIAGSKEVDPDDWFFAAHFKGDPVMPGSLGLEALLQLLQRYAAARWPDLAERHRVVTMPPPRPHAWTYRGQVRPHTERMEVVAYPKAVIDGPSPTLVADGYLLADGQVIYSMRDFSLSLVER